MNAIKELKDILLKVEGNNLQSVLTIEEEYQLINNLEILKSPNLSIQGTMFSL
jgi:hypothetical protein